MAHGDITHVDIPVTDNARAKEFYGGLFGWEFTEPQGWEDYPMWQAPNQVSGGMFGPRGEGFTQPRSTVEVDSIDETIAKAEAAGGSVLMAKSEISATSWWAVIVDPDGNHMGLYEGTTVV